MVADEPPRHSRAPNGSALESPGATYSRAIVIETVMKERQDRRRGGSVLPAPNTRCCSGQPLRREEADVRHLGIDWGTRRAAWCALTRVGELQEGMVSADEDGLARLVARLGPDVYGCIEMMSGAV
jgi:hypothetical protein